MLTDEWPNSSETVPSGSLRRAGCWRSRAAGRAGGSAGPRPAAPASCPAEREPVERMIQPSQVAPSSVRLLDRRAVPGGILWVGYSRDRLGSGHPKRVRNLANRAQTRLSDPPRHGPAGALLHPSARRGDRRSTKVGWGHPGGPQARRQDRAVMSSLCFVPNRLGFLGHADGLDGGAKFFV